MNARRAISLTWPARIVIALLVAGIAMDVVVAVADFDVRLFLDDLRRGISHTLAQANVVDDRRDTASLIRSAVLLATGIVFMVWLRRAYGNLLSLGRRDLRFGPAWAIGAWFVPFLNFVRPKQIVNDTWRGSSVSPSDARVPALVHWWWAVYLLASVGMTVARRSLFREETLTNVLARNSLNLVTDAIWIVAAVLAILVVRALTERQATAVELAAQSADQASV